MKNIKIKCNIYTRVSTTMQVDGYSLDAQKKKIKALCRISKYGNRSSIQMKVNLEKAWRKT